MSSSMPSWTAAGPRCPTVVRLFPRWPTLLCTSDSEFFRWPELRVAARWRSAGGSSLVVWTVESSMAALPFGGE
ncbi:hypothetical protein Dimus_010397, partial [Dionaea muscipula]